MGRFAQRFRQHLHRQALRQLQRLRASEAGQCLYISNIDLAAAHKESEHGGLVLGQVRAQACLRQKLGFGDELHLA